MNSEEFIDGIKLSVRDATVTGGLRALAKPAGRRPRQDLVEMSNWFNGLTEQDKAMVGRVIEYTADLATFSFLAVLDGAAVIEESPDKGDLELYYVKDDERVRLNKPNDPLHDIFNAT